MPTDPREALRAWFLGPRAENAELLERLVVDSLRDHVFWRRNYHPEDGFTIREMDKRQEGYEASVLGKSECRNTSLPGPGCGARCTTVP